MESFWMNIFAISILYDSSTTMICAGRGRFTLGSLSAQLGVHCSYDRRNQI